MLARAPSAETHPVFVLLVGGLALISALIGSTTDGPAAAILLVLLQATGLALWFRQGWTIGRGWPTANFVTGAAWAALFFTPSAVYAVAPDKLAGLDPVGAIAVVNISLFALLAGYVGATTVVPIATKGALLRVRPLLERPNLAAAWFGVGLAGLVVLMATAGGPAAYLSRLDETAELNAGLFYVIWISLALLFSPFALVFVRWGRGVRAGLMAVLLAAVGLGLLVLTGARSFVAVGAAQLVLASALVRGRPSLTKLMPVAILAALVLVFGFGTVKRHQSYNTQNPDAELSFRAYATEVAPHEFVDAYVNNYVDTVRLIALARAVVPDFAKYEKERPLVQLALKPIPGGIRPNLSRDKDIRKVFEPPGTSVYAEPLQATAYLAGGPFVVALVFALVGFAVAYLDRWLARPRLRSPAAAAAAIALCVQIPIMLRSGLPNGLAFLAIEVLGTAVVTWSVAGGALRFRRRASLDATEPPGA